MESNDDGNSYEQRLARLQAAIAAHLACAHRIDNINVGAQAVTLASGTGDAMEDAAHDIPHELRTRVLEARREMDAALRRLNQRSLLAARIAMVEQQCAWSRAVLARVPELMR